LDIFEYQARKAADASRPLAEIMRPKSLEEFVGQKHVVGKAALSVTPLKKTGFFQ